MRRSWFIMLAFCMVFMFNLAGCGGGSSSAPQKTAISGTVTFPSANGAAKVAAAAATTATAPTLEVRDLNGTLIKSVPLTLQTGTVNTYSYPAIEVEPGKDYVLKAVDGQRVLRALVDKAALSGASATKNVNNVTTTALIVVEKALNLTAGTLGATATAAQVQTASAALALTSPPATIESNITAAIAACTSATGTANAAQAQLASLASIVTAAVSSNVDPSAFVAGTSTATAVDAVTYTVSGSTATASSAPVSSNIAGTFVTVAAEILPSISSAGATSFTVGSAGSFAITGTGTMSVSGTLPSGVTFDAATGRLSGTPAAGSTGAYLLTVTATSNSLTATQKFTLTVNPIPSSLAFTTAMLSGKTFTEGTSNTLVFNANGTLTASDTKDALTWSVNSAGQVVVHNTVTNINTTVTALSGSISTGLAVSLAHSDGTTESTTLTLYVPPAQTTGFTAAMLSGKTFIEGTVNTLVFNANGTLIASDTPDALTWSVNSSGQVVVHNSVTNISTTVTALSGNLSTGLAVSLVDSNGPTASTTLTLYVAPTPVTAFTTAMLSGKTFTEGTVNTLAFNANGTLVASDTTDALTWSVNSSGQLVVHNSVTNINTTATVVSGNLTTGLTVSLVDSNGPTASTTFTLRP
ncbi:beta strand repeat-containing protein [Citrifermentans bemidjiense]|nr:putative Ig domain-containing protein [Citrifermentans bemidjiense]